MKISLNWLQDFVTLKTEDSKTIKDTLTHNSAEIETMENLGDHLAHIVVGMIDEVKPHPNADKLRLTIVNDGKEKLQVVCGGSNLKEGMKIAFAKVGAIVKWHGGEVVKIEPTAIRGEKSFGMICASEEIGLKEMFPPKQEKEIIDLSHLDAKVGTSLATALGLDDVILDVSNTAITHRSDLFSHRGFAREFVANKLAIWKKLPKPFSIPKVNSPAPIEINIEDRDVCSHYMGVYLSGIAVAESPEWLKQRLTACGVSPISNIVDITNYVMLELGMPTHAFDLDQVKGKSWTLRKSKKGEKVVTLDKKEHELPEGVTVLHDGHELIDLCGVMGGYTSGINAKTNKVWLIAPVYNPTLIRRAMRSLAHFSDAGTIYEKGVDNELAGDGLARCVELILQLCSGAHVASKVMDVKHYTAKKKVIKLESAQIKRLTGMAITPKETERILKDLGFSLKKSKGGYEVTIPSWRRGDVTREADLIEEIARIYGYEHIPLTTPVTDIVPTPIDSKRELEKSIRSSLMTLGYSELCTFAFLGPELLQKSGMAIKSDMIELLNPISSDMSIMRQSLLPRTLQTIADNLRYQTTFRLFELSRVYKKKGEGVQEGTHLILASVGEDFRNLQGDVESLGFQVIPRGSDAMPYEHPGRYADLMAGNKKIGALYEVHPQILKNFDIKPRIVIAEVDMTALHDLGGGGRVKYEELPRFPAVKLDISILIQKKELAEKYFDIIRKSDHSLIKNVEIIDEYVGEHIPEDKRSLTYSVTYQATDRTLTEDEVGKVHENVRKHLQQNGAVIR